jgi:hypothetical protein
MTAANQFWNYVSSPVGDSLTGWTATNGTATIVDRDYSDLLIPKYDDNATRIAVGASAVMTYKQVLADMVNIAANDAAGRKLTFGMWVHSRVAGRITIGIDDRVTSTYSDAHSGSGWALMTVEHTVAGTTTTGPEIVLRASSGDAMTIFWNRAWLYYGDKERLTECYTTQAFPITYRDFTTQKFTLSSVPARGRQIRLVGQDVLTALGGDPQVQVSNVMEVDDETSRILCARAALLLFEWEGITAEAGSQVLQRIAMVQQRHTRVRKFNQDVPRRGVISPYWR